MNCLVAELCYTNKLASEDDFKVLLLVYKALNGLGPKYISDLLIFYEPSRSLRSSGGAGLPGTGGPVGLSRRSHADYCPQSQNQTWRGSVQFLRATYMEQTARKL